jgi:photoactive yellow protein
MSEPSSGNGLEVRRHDVAQLDSMSEEELDLLPIGAIRVDAEGTILFYSRRESELTGRAPLQVLGKNFFRDIAPCTVVPEFFGRFRSGVLSGSLHTVFEFLFDFDMHPVRVRVSMRDSERDGEYWILVEPLEEFAAGDGAAARDLLKQKPDGAAGAADASVHLTARSIDFSRCEEEAIAHCGTIQPYGCLLVLESDGARVIAASDNTERFLGRPLDKVLGTRPEALFPAGDDGLSEALRAGAEAGHPPRRRAYRVPPQPGYTDLALDLRLTPWRGRLLLEIEPRAPMDLDEPPPELDLAALGAGILEQDDIAGIFERVTEHLREMTGFERVLAYRFEPNNDGIVIAESIAPNTMPSVLGLRYPASDIPRQARALYAETPLRYTPNRGHADIPLLARGVDPADLDIGAAQLRRPSPMHRVYQERFGVKGSMSLSLGSDGQLWGLLIFHHRKPHALDFSLRARLVEFAGLLSARVALLEERGRQRARAAGMAKISRFVGRIDLSMPFPQNLLEHGERLRELFEAESVQIYEDDQELLNVGAEGLSAGQMKALLHFLRGRGGGIWSTDCLSGEFEPAVVYSEHLAGVIAAFIGPAERYILLFGRRRSGLNVRWGADPVSMALGRGELESGEWTDRRFEAWTETRPNHAKPWSEEELGSAEALRSLTQEVIVASATRFEAMAMRDGLTGLPNRERFRELLAEAIRESAELGEMFGVGLLDIDHFKTVNDTLGHDKGDILLRAAAERIADALPATATVARLGGDEFALLLPAGVDDALDVMPQRVIEAFREPIIDGEDRFSVTASMGVTLGTGCSLESDLLKQADMALYKAKEGGRNCVRGFDSGLQQRALAHLEITREILSRRPDEAVEIWLQPQVPIIVPNATPRFEVLARWRTLAGHRLLPNDFMGAARQNGVMRDITEAVIRQAIDVLRRRLDDGVAMVLSVNLAAADLEARWFARNLIKQLDDAGVPRSMLEVEINERLLLRMTPSVRESLRQLTSAGVPLALDNFGSSFSSMGFLRELAVTTLKVDRGLVRGVVDEPDRRLVGGIIALARSLGKTTVAEGVERESELEILRHLGCDWGQGFLWSEPLPPEEAISGRWQPVSS